MNEYQAIVSVHGVDFIGVDMGGAMTVVGYGDGTLAVHVAGHSYWAGTGRPRSYAPARIDVYKIYERSSYAGGRLLLRLDRLFTIEEVSGGAERRRVNHAEMYDRLVAGIETVEVQP